MKAIHNIFTDVLFDLYEAKYFENKEKYKRKGLFGKVYEINTKALNTLNLIYSKADYIGNNVPSFESLFDFGTFIKITEKMWFYKNDKDSLVACDSQIEDEYHRILVLQFPNASVRLNLTKDKIDPDKNTVEVTVRHNFGKNMQNNYIVKSAKLEFYDYTDAILINHINLTCQCYMKRFLLYWAAIIWNKELNDYMTNPDKFVNPCKYKTEDDDMLSFDIEYTKEELLYLNDKLVKIS